MTPVPYKQIWVGPYRICFTCKQLTLLEDFAEFSDYNSRLCWCKKCDYQKGFYNNRGHKYTKEEIELLKE